MPTPAPGQIRPSQILEQIRSHYLARLRQAIEDHAGDGVLKMVPEAALRGRAGELLRRGDPPTPVRVDLITLLNDQVRDGLTIESETMPGFPPFSLRWKNELPVQINPFPWHACPITISGATPEMGRLIEWFDHWFDTQESKTPGEDGLLGVVHTIAKTGVAEGVIRLTIDFGSAPIEAFEEMIDAIYAAGITSLEIGAPAAPTA